MTARFIVFENKRVAYWRTGAAPDAVIFLHGDGQNHTAWAGLLELLPKNYSKISYDRPGHGRSMELSERTIARECAILEKLIAKEKIRRVVLIGHSSGAAIGAAFALEHTCNALVLSNPLFCDPHKLFAHLDIARMEEGYLGQAKGKYCPALQAHIYGREKDERELHEIAFVQTPFATLRKNLNLFVGYDISKQLGTLRIPILIILSDNGILSTKVHVEKTTAGLPNVRIEHIAQGTHNAFLLQKKEVGAALIKNFGFLGF